jgi:hypothetical protein
MHKMRERGFWRRRERPLSLWTLLCSWVPIPDLLFLPLLPKITAKFLGWLYAQDNSTKRHRKAHEILFILSLPRMHA